MVGAIAPGTVSQLQQYSTTKSSEPVAQKAAAGPAGTVEEPIQTSDLVFKPGTLKDNEAFAKIAEAGFDQRQQEAARHEGGAGKYAKSSFDFFSFSQNNAQRQLQALLTGDSLNALNSLLADISAQEAALAAAEAEIGAAATWTEAGGDTETVTETTTEESAGGSNGGGGSTDTGSGGTGTGDTGTGDTGGTTQPGNGKGSGKGGGGGGKGGGGGGNGNGKGPVK